MSKQKDKSVSLRDAMLEASRQVRTAPAWLKEIYDRNDQLDQHRRKQQLVDIFEYVNGKER